MNLAELLRVALRAIRAHKLRSFLTLLGIFPAALTSIRQAREINVATFLAEHGIEAARAADYATITASVNPPPTDTTITLTSNNVTPNSIYRTMVTYSPGPGGSGNSTMVTVLVTWTSDRLRSTIMGTEVAAP